MPCSSAVVTHHRLEDERRACGCPSVPVCNSLNSSPIASESRISVSETAMDLKGCRLVTRAADHRWSKNVKPVVALVPQ